MSKNLIPAFIQSRYRAAERRGTLWATTMFLDISGFTPLTETLLRHGTEGAELLSEILDSIFEPLVAWVNAETGIIPHFAGDAFTAIFANSPTAPTEAEQAERVLALAQKILAFFTQNNVRQTRFGDFNINVRIGLSHGLVEWGIIGAEHQTFYFRGDGVDRAAIAEHEAKPQQAVADAHFLRLLPPPIQVIFFEKSDFTTFAPLKTVDTRHDFSFERTTKKKADPQILESFLPKAILEFNEKGEFRNVVSVFIAFEQVESHDSLEMFVSLVLREIDSFSGYFKEIDFGDKGAIIVAFFGAPTAFENNAARAMECVLSLRSEIQHWQAQQLMRFRVGITSGVAYAGIVGGVPRCQYAIVGDRVNLAARLMQQAQWGEILVDSNMQHLRQFNFADNGTMRYKGVSKTVQTYQLLSKKSGDKPIFSGKMFGRENDLITLIDAATPILTAECGSIAYIFGEAGIGKSRLSFELRQALDNIFKVHWSVCQCDQILRKPFNPFIYFLTNYFEQSAEKSTAENTQDFETLFEKTVRSLPTKAYAEGAELIRTKSVLAALVGIDYEGSLWSLLDARGRYENTRSALLNLFAALAHTRPLVIELEDAHWLDEDSRTLLPMLAKKLLTQPILLLVTSRYNDEGTRQYAFDRRDIHLEGIVQLEVDLNILTHDALRAFAEHKLQRPIHDELHELLWRTTNGNPFYAEQILAYFIENNLLQLAENHQDKYLGQWNVKDPNVRVSTSIGAVLTARIDRLSLLVRETVKAAAVIGREFELPILSEVMLTHEAFLRRNGNAPAVLREQIQTAERGQIWQAMNELRYIFRHTLLREAIYDMQLKTRLRELHLSIARAIEKVYAERIEERYIDLAFHYEQADIKHTTQKYLKKAGDYARSNFQNQQALDLYDRLLRSLDSENDETELIKILVRKGEILQLIGHWHDSEIYFHEALFKAAAAQRADLQGRAHNALGNLLLLKGDYVEARPYLERAAAYFEQAADMSGIVRTYGNLGNLLFRQGEYAEAVNYLLRSLEMSRRLRLTVSAQIVANLGLTYMNQGNYAEGVRVQTDALAESERRNDKLGMAILNINLGIVLMEQGNDEAALAPFEHGLALAQALGNKQLISIALGSLGNLQRIKGNFELAATYLDDDLRMTRELGDRQGIAIACELTGKLYATRGEFEEALRFYEQSLGLCRALNYQKGIAKTLHGLGEVYGWQNDFLRAISSLDEAIAIAERINNRLILGQCLIEKANTLIKAGDISGAHALFRHAETVAKDLGNQQLLSQTRALGRKVA
jgi:class 3 adenylate cyclase/tetratricopeptide (TPR) repeat protein